MFTGIVEEIGIVKNLIKRTNSLEISVACSKILTYLKIGDSVLVDGVCQSVLKVNKNIVSFLAVKETLERSIFNNYKLGQKVNLERALTLNNRLDGHMVLGHVDCTGKIVSLIDKKNFWQLKVLIDNKFKELIVEKGSISINGISLTIAKIINNMLTLSIIPLTYNNTNLRYLKSGDQVNIEFDIIGKYVLNFLRK